jgi:S-DNA-T family DNA segregation ATPase FtsK/SpoIIIE
VSVAPILSSDGGNSQAATRKRKTTLPQQYRKNFRVEQREDSGERPAPQRDERLPPLDLLSNEPPFRADERNINLTAGLIEKTLAEFGIPARVVGFRVGPTVTQFAVEPGFVEKPGNEGDAARQKVRVAQVSALSRDLALALSAERLRIQAPVPGRPYIGIEVPNSHSAVVRLKPILESDAFYNLNSPLAIALGRDVSGQPVVADLGRMPHMLIAGTTGSGKSVCIAAITNCLVMNNMPEDLRLIMIDPKMVELVRFNGLPHLYGRVETDLQRILGVLHWTVVEMDRRYKLLESSKARNLDSYNRKARRRKDIEPLPRIVVFIDELADLMMSAPEETEPTLVRLAQMARATGIHLVVATQRPSTDVVTGLIKANFPARISFAVASSVDSRVILDMTGAESLLGRGDMLFVPPDAQAPLRSQGVMVSDQEVERVITFWQKSYPESLDEQSPWEKLLEEESILADRDDLVKKAIAIVRETQRASASMLQRRLRIGYPRAARLIDELEALGFIGPSQGGGREREVIISPEDELPEL